MTTTVKALSPAELRAGLVELHELADKYAALESVIESKALELQSSDWEFSNERGARFVNAISGELRGVYEWARPPSRRESEGDADELCQAIEDAIELLDFAIARNDEGGGESNAS